jgi:5-methylcytosine-specific restriction endonuclease McrA
MQKKYCSVRCKDKHLITAHRHKRKQMAVEYKGGECTECGTKHDLQFHHVNPADKVFQISDGYALSWEKLKEEVDKCILLCGPCHRIEHIGQ